jgi:hypothetical protein
MQINYRKIVQKTSPKIDQISSKEIVKTTSKKKIPKKFIKKVGLIWLNSTKFFLFAGIIWL